MRIFFSIFVIRVLMLNHQMVVVLWSEADTQSPVHEQPYASGIYKKCCICLRATYGRDCDLLVYPHWCIANKTCIRVRCDLCVRPQERYSTRRNKGDYTSARDSSFWWCKKLKITSISNKQGLLKQHLFLNIYWNIINRKKLTIIHG